MNDTITYGLNRRVAVSLSLSSFNLVSLEGMERSSLMQIVNLGRSPDMCQCKLQSKLLYVCNTKRQQNIAFRVPYPFSYVIVRCG